MTENDPGAFFDLLERDILRHPERLVAVSVDLVERLRDLTRGVQVNLNDCIQGPVEL